MDQISEWVDIKNKLNLTKFGATKLGVSWNGTAKILNF